MVIFVAHGSRDPKWRASVEEMLGSLQADLGRDEVRLAYMDHAPPTLADVFAEVVDAGATTARVIPLFLADAGHVERDIRPTVDQLRQRFQHVDVELLPSLGRQKGFRDLLREIATGDTANEPR
jgi:sirohydrochlorin cobaltochelatase